MAKSYRGQLVDLGGMGIKQRLSLHNSMKIAVSYFAQSSIFGSSRGQTSVNLADVFIHLGHDVTLVCGSNNEWWEDCMQLKNNYCIVPLGKCRDMDLLIDVGGCISPEIRKLIAPKTVLFLHGRVFFNELQHANYIQTNLLHHNIDDYITEIWAWDVFNDETEYECMRSLFPCPIYSVPYVWSPKFIKAYMELTGCTQEFPTIDISKHPCEIKIHICEKTTENTCSPIFPIVALSHIKSNSNKGIIGDCVVHIPKAMRENKFLVENIINNVKTSGMDMVFEERERYCDWITENNPFVISHVRFIPFRSGLIDLAWLGIPFVHNSTLLRDMGAGLRHLYYSESSITEMNRAFYKYISEPTLWTDFNNMRRELMEKTWSVDRHTEVWQERLASACGAVKEITEHIISVSVSAPVVIEQEPVLPQVSLPITITIGFTDMWAGFDPATNFFADMLQYHYPNTVVKGVNGSQEKCDILIFGPFSESWKSVPKTIPKIFFNGENFPFPESNEISLYLTFSSREDAKHIRFPLWIIYVKWFTENTDILDGIINPVGLPKNLVITSHPKPYSKRDKFCAFVVSNPCNEVRNNAFKSLNSYKHVDSGGMLYNNIGGPLKCTYPGGGSGDVAKFLFFQDYKYVLCYENSMGDGYVTEKLLHAKMAGCIPIYWGDKNVCTDFDPRGFIDVSDDMYVKGDCIEELIEEYEKNPERCEQIASVPILDPIRLNNTYSLMKTVSDRLYSLATATVPPPVEREVVIPSPIFVSYITKLFLDSAEININALEAHRRTIPKLRHILFLGPDIDEPTCTKLASRHPWIELRRTPVESPNPEFPDFWESKHYGWKLWILKNICADETLKDKNIVYTDAGAQWIRLPHDFIYKGYSEGVCLMRNDAEHLNKYWCSEKMIDKMDVQKTELETPQISAGIISFHAGHSVAMSLFDEALKWGLDKDVLCGRRLIGVLPSGQNYGHRHDQSILSVLSIRKNIPLVNGTDYLCSISLRKTFLENKYIYLHRGDYQQHVPVLPKIDDVWVVSLDRRKDRWDSLCKEYPLLASCSCRFSAIDGKRLELTQGLFDLFKYNDFIWKKSVMGCALSHILLWFQLAMEKPPVNSYLVLEDDVRFENKFFEEKWPAISETIPQDAELLYLGGVLPGNKNIYKDCLEPVNECWATIKPNTCFSRNGPSPVFHFCTYSYMITRKGAEKIINGVLSTGGCHTSIDHFLGWPGLGLAKYVMINLPATCFQENDPAYNNSEFDNFKRVDTFDSDIWNNVEMFDSSTFQPRQNEPLSTVLCDLLDKHPNNVTTKKLISEQLSFRKNNTMTKNETTATVTTEEPKNEIVLPSNYVPSLILSPTPQGNSTSVKLYFYGKCAEIEWLRNFWPNIVVEEMPMSVKSLVENPWFVINHPHIGYWRKIFNEYESAGKHYSIIHLNDEHERDMTDFYNNKHCKHVIRNYIRNLDTHLDLETTNILTIPLGALLGPGNNSIKSFSDRKLAWSFHGKDLLNRNRHLSSLVHIDPHDLRITSERPNSEMSSEKEYCNSILDSKFCPIPRGNNCETNRLYEALEMGSIPIYVRSASDDMFWNWISKNLSLIEIKTWEKASVMMNFFLNNPDHGEKYRAGIMQKWSLWKTEICTTMSGFLG